MHDTPCQSNSSREIEAARCSANAVSKASSIFVGAVFSAVGSLEKMQDAAHQIIDRFITTWAFRQDFFRRLNISCRHQFIAAMGDYFSGQVRCCFEVELQADYPLSELKSLILTTCTLGDLYRSRRQIKCLAVPMKDYCRWRKIEDRAVAGGN